MRTRPHARLCLVLCLSVLAACSAEPASSPDSADHGTHDIATEADGTTPSADADATGPLCTDGEATCSEDATTLTACVDGAWHVTACLADEGRLCEAGACVDPWRLGDPAWSTCDDDPLATTESLAAKAATFDDIATRLHLHPEMPWVMNVTLAVEEVPCEGEAPGPCTAPVASEADATWADVAVWHTGENDGLWSGLYLASQAFRYAVTGSSEALETVRTLLNGEVERMAITGVPGVFTRQLIPPGIDGISCPSDPVEYVPDTAKDDNQWVMIGESGCVEVTDPETLAWVETEHCGLDAFVGYCWLDNVSQDEYAGHMLALAAIVRLVDDVEVRETAVSLIEQVGVHLMEHDLAFVDWDGRVTEHGKLWVTSFADAPGFLAIQAMAFLKLAVTVSERADLAAFYEGCVLQRGDAAMGKCLSHGLEVGDPYTDHLETLLAYVGDEGCKSNYNNFSMVMTYFFEFLWFERDPELRAQVQAVFDEELMRADSPRALIGQQNAWFNVMWASMKHLGPGSDGPAYQAVEDVVCSLRQFAASKATPTLDPGALYPHYCDGRLGGSQTEHPVPVAERCPSRFLWWGSPYSRGGCQADPTQLSHPGDYLLAYWMGRYFGFISEDL